MKGAIYIGREELCDQWKQTTEYIQLPSLKIPGGIAYKFVPC